MMKFHFLYPMLLSIASKLEMMMKFHFLYPMLLSIASKLKMMMTKKNQLVMAYIDPFLFQGSS
jgi:hypothetical protein